MAEGRGWYYTRGGQSVGPIAMEALRGLIGRGEVARTDLVWCEGMGQWAVAQSVGELVAGLPPVLPGAPVAYASAPMQPARDIGQDAGMRMLLPVGRSGWAIAAGYLGLFSLIIFPAPIALIISIIAIVDIKKHPEKHGMGRAIFGLVMGLLGSLVICAAIVAMATGK